MWEIITRIIATVIGGFILYSLIHFGNWLLVKRKLPKCPACKYRGAWEWVDDSVPECKRCGKGIPESEYIEMRAGNEV